MILRFLAWLWGWYLARQARRYAHVLFPTHVSQGLIGYELACSVEDFPPVATPLRAQLSRSRAPGGVTNWSNLRKPDTVQDAA